MDQQVLTLYGKFGERATLLRQRSTEVAGNWTGGTVDLIFIDAEHDTQSCSEDIRAWMPLLRSGGILAGDDYMAGGGVQAAVHALKPPDVQLHVAPNGVWWWIHA